MSSLPITHKCNDCQGGIMAVDKHRCPHCGSFNVAKIPAPVKADSTAGQKELF